jgi:hypothetical protein
MKLIYNVVDNNWVEGIIVIELLNIVHENDFLKNKFKIVLVLSS